MNVLLFRILNSFLAIVIISFMLAIIKAKLVRFFVPILRHAID